MRCLVCDKNEWENVDKYRVLEKHKGKPVGMCICNSCGFVSYPEKYKTEEEIKEYYRNEYRGGAPSYGNIITGKRKLHYHGAFLKDLFNEWKKEGNDKPVVGEIGSAIGMVLNWVKQIFPGAEVYGTELTKTFVNVAYSEFCIKLEEDFDTSKKYDLIMTYKVAEHQLDVDKRIREYALALKENGRLYISVPTWFNALSNPGVGGFDLEYYYHPDHVNVWTRIHFEEVLRKSGLEIIKVDRLIYGDTYLCKRNDEVMKQEPQYEDPAQIKGAMDRIKKAANLMQMGKSREALEQWGNFPTAWFTYYEQSRKELHEKYNGDGLVIAETICKEMSEACGTVLEVKFLYADICHRYGHIPEAIASYESILETKPNETRALFSLSNCIRALAESEKDPEKKTRLLLTSRDICRSIMLMDESQKPEAYNWALKDESLIDVNIACKILTKTKGEK